jgi:hypothetical protein
MKFEPSIQVINRNIKPPMAISVHIRKDKANKQNARAVNGSDIWHNL